MKTHRDPHPDRTYNRTAATDRRTFLSCLGIGAGSFLLGGLPAPPFSQLRSEPKKTTFTYKKTGALEIKADVLRVDDGRLRPACVWIHGGALMKGHREKLNQPALQFLEAGYVVVSIDYRLAPESKLPDILQDVTDACAWVREEGERLFKAKTQKIAVAGGSAGGYLALSAGFLVDPPPAAVVSIFGFGELVGKWCTSPSIDPSHYETGISGEEAARLVPGAPVADERDRKYDIRPYYNYYRQQGTWPYHLTGWDPLAEPEKFYPYLPARNVTNQYPPTMLIHGEVDPDVPVEQSRNMAREFGKHGVPHELIVIPGAEHGLRGGDTEQVERAYRTAVRFVERFTE